MRLARFGCADLRGLIDYAYTDSFYTYAYQLSGPGDAGFDPSNQVAADVEVPSTGLLNLRLSLSNVKLGSTASGELALWCHNVPAEDAPTNLLVFGPDFGTRRDANSTEPCIPQHVEGGKGVSGRVVSGGGC